MDNRATLSDLKKEVDNFIIERDWKQFHNPQDLAVSIAIESAELLEIFQWGIKKELSLDKIEKVKEELADILIYSLSLANVSGLDVSTIIRDKIKKNAIKYPVEKVRGKAKKYTEYNK